MSTKSEEVSRTKEQPIAVALTKEKTKAASISSKTSTARRRKEIENERTLLRLEEDEEEATWPMHKEMYELRTKITENEKLRDRLLEAPANTADAEAYAKNNAEIVLNKKRHAFLEEQVIRIAKDFERRRQRLQKIKDLDAESAKIDEEVEDEQKLDEDDDAKCRAWDNSQAGHRQPPEDGYYEPSEPGVEPSKPGAEPSKPGAAQFTISNVNDKMVELMNAQLKLLTNQKPHHYVERDLPVFDGKPDDWIAFQSQFNRTTERYKFDDTDNLYRLRKALKGHAWEAVKFYFNNPYNVTKIMDSLELEFGRAELVVESLIRQVENVRNPDMNKPETVVEFARAVQTLVASCRAHNQLDYLNNVYLLNKLVDKMPSSMKWEWVQFHRCTPNAMKNLDTFEVWISVKKEMACELIKPKFEAKSEERKPKRGPASLNVMAKAESPGDGTKICAGCDKPNHHIDVCRTFSKLKNKEKWDLVKEKNLCFVCLRKGHKTNDCQKPVCGVDECDKKHHKTLHFVPRQRIAENGNRDGARGDVPAVQAPPPMEVNLDVAVVKGTAGPLPIVRALVRGPNGIEKCYALLDTGANTTLIENSLADKLGLSGERVDLTCRGYSGVTKKEKNARIVEVDIRGDFKGSSFVSLNDVATVDDIGLAPYSLDMEEARRRWPVLKKMNAKSMVNVVPQMLIGTKHRHLTIPREVLCSSLDGPVATRTQLGWVLEGNLQESKFGAQLFCMNSRMEFDDALHETVKQAFKVEDFGIKPQPSLHSVEEKKALGILESTTKFEDGRWEVGLLWKNPEYPLPTDESKTYALQRLLGIEKRMQRDPKFHSAYEMKIAEYLKKQFCRKLSTEEAAVHTEHTYYVSHFGVLNPNKPGKFRLVFDCAAKIKGESFNDVVYTGPDLLRPLTSVLWNYRRYKFVIGGDIEDMFHRIGIRREDRCAQRFLWRNGDMSREPDVYEMEVMLFGNTSSPSAANYVKNLNADRWKEKYPAACRAIHDQFYMDDALLGGSSVEEVIELRRQITEICSAGNFTIKKWISNNLEITESIPEDLRLHGEKNLDEKAQFPSERVLGLWWNPPEDSFSFKLNFHKVKPEVLQGNRPTKREMTSLVMSLYDPLGFISNYKVKGMILLQNTWRSGVGWDDEVPDEIFENWKLWLEELPGITTVKIPRWYGEGVDDDGDVELHTFADASEEAYCAVSYYRTGNGENVVLVSSKVKVASLRKMTIPRLELQAAVLGANLANTISDEIKVKVKRFYFWSDSTTVLSWLRNPTSKYQEFVANRIGRIQEITKIEDWRWVPTADNVADEATRLKKPTDLSTESRWFQAPSFLRRPKEEWPAEKKLYEESQVTTAAADGDEDGGDIGDVVIPGSVDPLLPSIERFSSYSRLVRATAAVKAAFGFWKAKTMTKKKPDPVWKLTSSHFTSGITAQDMKEAELKLIRFVQNSSYLTMVMKLECLGNKKMKVLSPFIDPADGILKSAGRFANSKHIGDEQKYPIILPPKHPFTQLLIMREHVKNGHTGQMTTLNNLRKRFWIIDGLQAVKRCSRKCWKCRLERAKPVPALMGNLPSYRTASGSPAFSFTGVDYFGPMEVTVGRRHEKRWGVLFTDLVIRGVHLEVAHGLTTDEMILALSRFVDIRGRPKLMISDNGTNLVGASNELKNAVASLDYQKIMEQEKFMEMKWSFIPAASPHLGGAWERMVQSVKKVLMSVLREKYPKDTTLLTVMKTAENVVNSRPLSALSSNIGDPVALTPNHFLRGQVDMGPSIPVDLKERDEYYRTRWQYSQALSEEFWRRWALEVLPNLRKREKWNESADPLQVGDIVLMVDDQLPRNCWVKAVVTATFPGSDGHVRVAEVTRRFYGLKADKTYKRSVMKLCPLGLQMEKPVAKAPDLGAGNVGV